MERKWDYIMLMVGALLGMHSRSVMMEVWYDRGRYCKKKVFLRLCRRSFCVCQTLKSGFEVPDDGPAATPVWPPDNERSRA